MNIRLIAADMDGTLLDSRKQLPEGLFPLVRALHERGVRFAPASGASFTHSTSSSARSRTSLCISARTAR